MQHPENKEKKWLSGPQAAIPDGWHAPCFVFNGFFLAKIFPTYYALQPVVKLSLEGGDWSAIAVNVFILIGIAANAKS